MEFKRISMDTSKHVFSIHGVDEQERPGLRREIRRAQVEQMGRTAPRGISVP